MARYFKYRSPDELAADAVALGHELPLATSCDALFRPLQIGSRTIGNRLVALPMEGCDATIDGRPDELTFRRFRRFGAGGAKLIWGEATAVLPEGRANPRQLLINDATASALEQMLAGCRQAHREAFGQDADLLVGLQLTHSGRYSFVRCQRAMQDPVLDPVTRDAATGKLVTPDAPLISNDELLRIQDAFVAAAVLASMLGFDFVDLKQCHRYLLSELLAARTRPGPYGGSLENRTRMIRELIGRIREAVPDLLIATRLNAYDGVPFRKGEPDDPGVPSEYALPVETSFGARPDDPLQEDSTEPIEVARRLRDWGVSLINVTAGSPYACPHFLRPAEFPPVDGYPAPEHPLLGVLRHIRLTSRIQAAVPEIPVAGSGYSWLQEFAPLAAAAQISAGHAQLVGFGRATLSHPDFARALQETGQLNRKQICRTFSYCTGLMRAKHHPLGQFPTGCPPFDKEVYGPIWEEAKPRP